MHSLTSSEKKVLIFLTFILLLGAALKFYTSRIENNSITLLLNKPVLQKSIYSEKIDINHASFEELCTLPGVGKTIAARIIEYRVETGDIGTKDRLLEIKGIGQKKLQKIKNHIFIG